MDAFVLPPTLDGLNRIAGLYDTLICDVWGVIHNGREPIPSAVNALQSFRAASGPVILLSNAPRLAAGVKMQFDTIGVPHDCYDAIVTSGEATRESLILRAPPGPPLPVFYLGPDRDLPGYAGLNITRVSVDDARLVLCVGPFNDEVETPDDYRELLRHCRERELDLLCANPDIVAQRGDKIVYCAGALARAYEEIGGKSLYFGKPYPQSFETALAKARAFGPANKPLVIGDGLETDIRGANALGWDAVFIVGGLHGAQTENLPPAARDQFLSKIFQDANVRARAQMDQLSW